MSGDLPKVANGLKTMYFVLGLIRKNGENFYCKYKGGSRQREESRMNMAGRHGPKEGGKPEQESRC